MKCFIVTRGDPRRFRVLGTIKLYGWTPTFCCDNDQQRKKLVGLGISAKSIILSRIPLNPGIQGVSLARDFVCKNLMPKNEWCVWIDDNVGSITGLLPSLVTEKIDFKDGINWRKEFERVLTRSQLDWHIRRTIDRADSVGTIFCGFANENNFFFRGRHWQDYGYCRTQFALYKNDGSTWMPFETMMLEDLYKSIDVVCRYGQVVINRFVKPKKPMFETGGIGSFKDRLPWLQDNCKRLMEMYPGLLKYQGSGDQYGLPEAKDFHVTFARRSKTGIDRWRKEHA